MAESSTAGFSLGPDHLANNITASASPVLNHAVEEAQSTEVDGVPLATPWTLWVDK